MTDTENFEGSVSYGRWADLLSNNNENSQSQIVPLDKRFDTGFSHRYGSSFILKRPLSKELAGQLKIINNRYQLQNTYTSFSKELTIGILDGQYTNRLDLLRFNSIFNIDPTQNYIFQN